MIRVAVSGAGGKLAGAIISAVIDAEDTQLSALYNPTRTGEVQGERPYSWIKIAVAVLIGLVLAILFLVIAGAMDTNGDALPVSIDQIFELQPAWPSR